MRNLLARYLSWSGAVERSRPPHPAGWLALGALFLLVGLIVLVVAAVKGSLMVIVGIAVLLEGPPLFWRSHRDHRRLEAYRRPPSLRLSSNTRAGLPSGRSTRRSAR
jgi:Flp pilus assembly protein TadB